MKAWVGTVGEGGLVDAAGASVSILDHGFTVADGIFETLKVVDGIPFALTRHLRRLASSAAAMDLPQPNDGWIRHAVQEVLDGNPHLALGRLRITYTAGIAPLGSDRGDASATLAVAMAPATPWPPTASAITVPWARNERSPIVGVKSTSYAENVIALRQAHSRGASEAIFGNTRGELCEGTGTNVFVVLHGELLTPPLTSGCLAGITRELVLEWSAGKEQVLPLEVLERAEEVFLTSSTRDVQPVTTIDGRALGEPGPLTREVSVAFHRHATQGLDP